ncbi:MAG: hypothetical protein Q9M50_01560 [Methylococcales bacterium]|nr:hypothetical protein [Methylococcales bacterium]
MKRKCAIFIIAYRKKTVAVTRGQQELKTDLSNEKQRIRKSGGGRNFLLPTLDGIDEVFLDVLKNNTAGSPMDETIKWTNLSRPAIAKKLGEQGFPMSVTVVDRLLKKHNFRPRQAFKAEAGKSNIPYRDEQFKNIERLKQEYTTQGDPVLSINTSDSFKSRGNLQFIGKCSF